MILPPPPPHILLWGDKTLAFFDVWSIEHFISGINLYCLSVILRRKIHVLNIAGWIVAFCFGWEMLEHYLETGLAGNTVTNWFQGVEFWGNRMVTDPLLIFGGAMAAHHYHRLHLPAKIASALWLILHIFIFPDSMYLQRFL